MVNPVTRKSQDGSGSENHPKLSRPSLEQVAEIFSAFADATRLGILQELRAGRLSVGALVTALGTSQANISKHLKHLHQAGLLIREREGAQVFYRVSEESVYEMCQFACKRLHAKANASVLQPDDYFI
ncbi:MAG: metalloregulator ArsR/SmtB family transcription factor [Luteolibacter sp.]